MKSEELQSTCKSSSSWGNHKGRNPLRHPVPQWFGQTTSWWFACQILPTFHMPAPFHSSSVSSEYFAVDPTASNDLNYCWELNHSRWMCKAVAFYMCLIPTARFWLWFLQRVCKVSWSTFAIQADTDVATVSKRALMLLRTLHTAKDRLQELDWKSMQGRWSGRICSTEVTEVWQVIKRISHTKILLKKKEWNLNNLSYDLSSQAWSLRAGCSLTPPPLRFCLQPLIQPANTKMAQKHNVREGVRMRALMDSEKAAFLIPNQHQTVEAFLAGFLSHSALVVVNYHTWIPWIFVLKEAEEV